MSRPGLFLAVAFLTGCGIVDADDDVCVGMYIAGTGTDDCIHDLVVDINRGTSRTVVLEATTKDGSAKGAATIDHNGGGQAPQITYQWQSLQLQVPGTVTLVITAAPGQGPQTTFESIVRLSGPIDLSLDLTVQYH